MSLLRTWLTASLLSAVPLAAQQPAAAPASPYAVLAGVVADSIHGGPLIGAMVIISGSDRQGIVDSTGRFRIDSIPPGDHELGVFHPLLDSLNVSVASKNVAFPAGVVTTVYMATPSAATIVSVYCTEEERKRGMAAVIGKVLAAESDDAVKDATVRYTWLSNLHVSGRAIKHDVLTREAKTKPTGEFAICGLPVSQGGTVSARRGDVVTGEMVADVSRWLVATVTLRLDTLKRGSAVVLGRIVDDKGAPLAKVDILLAGSHFKTATSDSGTFALRDLPAGDQTIQVRKVGYTATDTALMLSSKTPVQVAMTLRPGPVTLSTVNVVRESALQRVGFEHRKKVGIGYFMTEDQIRNRGETMFSDLARTIPGLTVRQNRNGQTVIMQSRGRTMTSRGCVAYSLDNSPFYDNPPGTIDAMVKPDDIIALEVYDPAEAPAQLGITSTSCSIVVIWTRATSQGQ